MPVILVTGANGQLGSELKEISRNYYGYDFIFVDIGTLDLTDTKQATEYIKSTKPNWIINCAAYNAVDQAETNPNPAMLVNAHVVRTMADAIKDTDCRLIHISTDYVYDGMSSVPYNENAAVGPLSAYGTSKLAGEKYALQHPASIIIRTSWLYSSFGNNFVKTILRHAREKESLNIVFDQTGTPTYAADLAAAIMHIVAGVIRNQLAFNSGIYNYSNEGVCTWYDFAIEIIREAGLKCNVKPVLSKDFRQVARRPSYSVMDKTKIKESFDLTIPYWRDSLLRCIKLMK